MLKFYSLFISFFDGKKDFILLLFRLYWGWLFFNAGLWKFQNYDKAVVFFNYLGLPFPEYFVMFIASVELFGGILIFFGLFGRVSALILTINMIGAYIVGHKDALMSIFSKPENFYHAEPATFLIVSLVVLFFGSGKFSVDRFLYKDYS